MYSYTCKKCSTAKLSSTSPNCSTWIRLQVDDLNASLILIALTKPGTALFINIYFNYEFIINMENFICFPFFLDFGVIRQLGACKVGRQGTLHTTQCGAVQWRGHFQVRNFTDLCWISGTTGLLVGFTYLLHHVSEQLRDFNQIVSRLRKNHGRNFQESLATQGNQ